MNLNTRAPKDKPTTAAKTRLRAFSVLFALLVVVIVVRLTQLMIFKPLQITPPSILLPVVERGPILDRNGRILAISTRLDSVSAWIPNLVDPPQSARQLARILSLPEQNILGLFEDHDGFVFIKRKITPTESERIQALKSEGELKGIDLVPEFGRTYPEQSLAAHVLGYVGVDNVGLAGIEYTLNNSLSPPAVSQESKEVYGNQVFLTLDINIQFMIEEIAAETLQEHRADSVFILVMDAQTAEILGYASAPTFDPNEYNRFDPQSVQNLPLINAYEPGSVFKIISIASILQLGGIDFNTEFLCTGSYQMQFSDGEIIKINDLARHGTVNAQKILKFSCNVGAALASEYVEAAAFHRMLIRFGFDRATELPLPGESSGILADPERWSGRTKATIAFGQEISVSAVQMLSAATVFANNGLLLKPQVVKKIISPQGTLVKEFGREPVREVLSPDIARAVLEMMETATQEGGTARLGRIEGIRISGKTGTAEVLDPNTGTYSETNFVASYIGILPTDEPRLIIYTVINHPRGEQTYGSQVAAPVFKKTAEQLISYLGIPTSEDTVVTHSGEVRITLPADIVIGSTMPDLTGTPKRLLLPLLQKDLKIQIIGDGYVFKQYPSAGTPIAEGMQVILELR